MPFTGSHAAAALPFLRSPLLPAPLVIGTMAPDVPYYLPLPGTLEIPRTWTHHPVGVLWIDLVMGLLLVVLWYGVVREPVIDLAPGPLRRRVPVIVRRGWRPAGWGRGRGIALVVASLVLGSLTHVVWDAFTHPGPVVDAIPGLDAELGPLVAHKWVQHSSTVVGAVVLAVWSLRWIRRTPPSVVRPRTVPPVFGIVTWVLAGLASVAAALIVWIPGIASGDPPLDPSLVFRVARVFVATLLAVTLVAVAAWHLQRRGTKGTSRRAS